ncbi:MAG: hypothetical protein WKF83_17035 [Nocardioidaceae bacterium]
MGERARRRDRKSVGERTTRAGSGPPARSRQGDRLAARREIRAGLDHRAGDPGLEPLAEILTANPGASVEHGTLERLLFKGVRDFAVRSPDG